MLPVLEQAVIDYGLWVLAAVILVECLGIPAPAQTGLLAAAIFAGSGGGLDIRAIIAVSVVSAFIGSEISFHLARLEAVDRFVDRYGGRIGFGEKRRAVAERLIGRYGAAVVVIGRFIAVLRTFSGLIAGIMGMRALPFLLANLVGSLAWGLVIGSGGYILGDGMRRLSGEIQIAAGALVVVGFLAVFWAFRRYERRFEERSSGDPGERG